MDGMLERVEETLLGIGSEIDDDRRSGRYRGHDLDIQDDLEVGVGSWVVVRRVVIVGCRVH